MTDQELIQALRRLDRPIDPELRFATDLFDRLGRERRRARRRPSRAALLFVAAAVALTTIAVGVVASGARPMPLPSAVPTLAPSVAPVQPSPTSPATTRVLTGAQMTALSSIRSGVIVRPEGSVWALVPDGLARIDPETRDVTQVDIGVPPSLFAGLIDGGFLVHVFTDTRIYPVDPLGRQEFEPTPLATHPIRVHWSDDGYWVDRERAIDLVGSDGKVLRWIETRAPVGTPYSSWMTGPLFGSLWEYDRSEGVKAVHRIDKVSGETIETIPVRGCGWVEPLTGVTGLPEAVVCGPTLIDPATNQVIGTIDAGLDFPMVAGVVDGQLWATLTPPTDAPDQRTRLARIDPLTLRPVEVVSLADQNASAATVHEFGDWVLIVVNGVSVDGFPMPDGSDVLVRVSKDDFLG